GGAGGAASVGSMLADSSVVAVAGGHGIGATADSVVVTGAGTGGVVVEVGTTMTQPESGAGCA
ncbi:MAG: hypothetical protein ACSLE8_02735, partial [Rhodococcus sp. (in: high G+C Gram-positive bacteria)]